MKPNNKGNGKNYFTKNINNDGEGFLDRKKSRDFERECPIIFRDLARGNIDISKYGHYFLDQQFLSSLIKKSYQLRFEYGTITQALSNFINGFIVNHMQVPYDISELLRKYQRKATAYNIIINSLEMLLNSKDLNYLYVLANQLKDYKYDI